MTLLFTLLVAAAAAGEPAPPPAAVRTLTVEQVAAWLACDKRLVIIDNDPLPMHQRKHLPGAVWRNYREITAASLPDDKTTPLLFYCYSER